MGLYKLHMLAHPPKLPNGPATYQLLIVSSSQSGSVQSVNFPSWDALARKLAGVGVGEGELQAAKRDYRSVPVTYPIRTTQGFIL
jgi:hypothetical protein